MRPSLFPLPPPTVWAHPKGPGVASFLREVTAWSRALRGWLDTDAEAEGVSPGLCTMLRGLLDGHPDGARGAFPRRPDGRVAEAPAVLRWRAQLVDYLSDVWDVVGTPRFDLAECQLVLEVLSGGRPGLCAQCLLPVGPPAVADHWRFCPARLGPDLPPDLEAITSASQSERPGDDRARYGDMPDPDDQDKTPPDHQVIALRVDAALLPEWFDAIKALAVRYARRMAVLEKPDEWVVRVELPNANVAPFKEHLGRAWDAFVAERKALGLWPDGDDGL